MKTDELRALYDKVSKQKKEAGSDFVTEKAYDDSDASFVSDAVSAYFSKNKGYTGSAEHLIQRRPHSEKIGADQA